MCLFHWKTMGCKNSLVKSTAIQKNIQQSEELKATAGYSAVKGAAPQPLIAKTLPTPCSTDKTARARTRARAQAQETDRKQSQPQGRQMPQRWTGGSPWHNRTRTPSSAPPTPTLTGTPRLIPLCNEPIERDRFSWCPAPSATGHGSAQRPSSDATCAPPVPTHTPRPLQPALRAVCGERTRGGWPMR